MKTLIRKILIEQFYPDDDREYVEKYASAYNDFGDLNSLNIF